MAPQFTHSQYRVCTQKFILFNIFITTCGCTADIVFTLCVCVCVCLSVCLSVSVSVMPDGKYGNIILQLYSDHILPEIIVHM